jgi:hypothetical protein
VFLINKTLDGRMGVEPILDLFVNERMRKTCFCLLLTIGFFIVMPATAQLNLQQFNQERLNINKKGFLVLGSWSAVNIISGIIGQSSASGEAKYFHRMDIIWGSVNLLVALPGYIGARKSPIDLALAGSIKNQSVLEKTFAFNAGLDLAYIAAGAWTLEKGKTNSNPDKYRGYGKSIIMQGAFLLLFDAVMFTTHNRHGKKLIKVLDTVQLSPNSLGLKVVI